MLLSFRGRISRSQYWLARLVLSALFLALLVLVFVMADWVEGKAKALGYLITLVILADLLVAWLGLALDVKRLHDHGLSARWVVAALVPVVGVILPPILFYSLRGTRGANRYGPDPVPPKRTPDTASVAPTPNRRRLESIF